MASGNECSVECKWRGSDYVNWLLNISQSNLNCFSRIAFHILLSISIKNDILWSSWLKLFADIKLAKKYFVIRENIRPFFSQYNHFDTHCRWSPKNQTCCNQLTNNCNCVLPTSSCIRQTSKCKCLVEYPWPYLRKGSYTYAYVCFSTWRVYSINSKQKHNAQYLKARSNNSTQSVTTS